MGNAFLFDSIVLLIVAAGAVLLVGVLECALWVWLCERWRRRR